MSSQFDCTDSSATIPDDIKIESLDLPRLRESVWDVDMHRSGTINQVLIDYEKRLVKIEIIYQIKGIKKEEYITAFEVVGYNDFKSFFISSDETYQDISKPRKPTAVDAYEEYFDEMGSHAWGW